jgi:hypothetical protein
VGPGFDEQLVQAAAFRPVQAPGPWPHRPRALLRLPLLRGSDAATGLLQVAHRMSWSW